MTRLLVISMQSRWPQATHWRSQPRLDTNVQCMGSDRGLVLGVDRIQVLPAKCRLHAQLPFLDESFICPERVVKWL